MDLCTGLFLCGTVPIKINYDQITIILKCYLYTTLIYSVTLFGSSNSCDSIYNFMPMGHTYSM